MKITAAVVRERAGAFNIETLDLDDPRADELLVEVVGHRHVRHRLARPRRLFPEDALPGRVRA